MRPVCSLSWPSNGPTRRTSVQRWPTLKNKWCVVCDVAPLSAHDWSCCMPSLTHSLTQAIKRTEADAKTEAADAVYSEFLALVGGDKGPFFKELREIFKRDVKNFKVCGICLRTLRLGGLACGHPVCRRKTLLRLMLTATAMTTSTIRTLRTPKMYVCVHARPPLATVLTEGLSVVVVVLLCVCVCCACVQEKSDGDDDLDEEEDVCPQDCPSETFNKVRQRQRTVLCGSGCAHVCPFLPPSFSRCWICAPSDSRSRQ
jgi:hypothetical protein